MFARSRLASVALSAVLIAVTAMVSSPAGVHAGAESDIPGIPLLGSVASGQLGGPIYDVVYRVAVQPGYVIVAGLTGSAGTDFDLYLFDSTATTVVSTQGLLARSAGPTSTEGLSYPSFAGGTYYIDLNGASNVEGTYRLTVQFARDSSTPSASLLLDNGRASTNSAIVPVALTGVSALSGIAAMAFSGDGVNFGPWQSYSVSSTWTFVTGDGIKTLWAKVRNGVGTESPVVSASIMLDSVPPTLTSITPTANALVSGLRPTFAIRFSEPIDPVTWNDGGLVVQAASGLQIAGKYSYDVRSWTGTFVPDTDLQAGAPYVVNVGAVTDLAGNLVNSVGSWVVTPLPVPSLALSVSNGLVLPGTAVTLSGQATDLDGQPVFLETRQGASTTVERSPIVITNGAWTTTLVPAVNSWYRLVFDGSTVAGAAASNEVRVIVRRTVTLVGVTSSVSRIVTSGTRVTLTARVGPPAAGAALSFQLLRYDVVKRAYVLFRSFGRTTDVNGGATLAWTTLAGRWYWKVAVLPSPDFANNITPAYRWTVTGG